MTTTIGITGAYGFLGWHMRCFLHAKKIDNARLAGRDTFASPDALAEFVKGCDVIFHFAGINRAGSEDEIRDGNRELAQRLVTALETAEEKPHVIYSSSIHADGDSLYGLAKRNSGEILGAWAKRADARYTTIMFPHLYGECGRPYYNSAVHTFCHQLANGETPVVTGNAKLNLLHAQDAAHSAWHAFETSKTGEVRPAGFPILVGDVVGKLEAYYASYVAGVIPDLRDPDDCKLFNVLRTAMFPVHYPMHVKRHEDPRGWLFEAIREQNGGQVFISSTNPDFTRGNHYHRFKVERFCVLSGNAVIRIRRLFSDDVHEFAVTGDEPCFIDMPPLHTHSIENKSDSDVITLFWANEFFDHENQDTYPEPVILSRGS